MSDLFAGNSKKIEKIDYTAKDIVVLEGLEPVRKRPGMYIGGTDEQALHHLVAEILDNSMDEAIAGHATAIDVILHEEGSVTVRDNGRGIPVDPHPKYPEKSALEVILTTLHSGGKFDGNAYKTSGGLHGVGLSVVNALSEWMNIEVARERQLWTQRYERGIPGTLKSEGEVRNRRGTSITFYPDHLIFGSKAHFRASKLFKMIQSKAYLYKGVTIHWTCHPSWINDETTPEKKTIHFPGGLYDYLKQIVRKENWLTRNAFEGEATFPEDKGRIEWAIIWEEGQKSRIHSYCNTVPTPLGGSHETGLRSALLKSIKAYGELTGNKKVQQIIADDIIEGATIIFSLFIKNPQFQGQTKEKLSMTEASKLVDNSLKDRFDHWLSLDPKQANILVEHIQNRAEERLKKKQTKELARQSATRRLRLPGKLADCSKNSAEGTELFIVEGDSAGGSAKQARNRETQAILPLRGKILNVASATFEKMQANQELSDLIQALGCGIRDHYDEEKLRYQRVIIMTDADVDGAHIASLLMTFFFKEMPKLIENNHLFLAMPPLYRLTQGSHSVYAKDDAHKDELMTAYFKGKGKIDLSRFKGLGEMPPRQLKETTMDPKTRTLLEVNLEDAAFFIEDTDQSTDKIVETLMGKKPEGRLHFIQKNARFVDQIDV